MLAPQPKAILDFFDQEHFMDKKLNSDVILNEDATRRVTCKSAYSTPHLKSYGNAVEITLGAGGPNLDGGPNLKSHL